VRVEIPAQPRGRAEFAGRERPDVPAVKR